MSDHPKNRTRRFAWLCLLALAGFTQTIEAAPSVTLVWSANTETNLAGYRLHYGLGQGSYSSVVQVSSLETAVTLANLQANKKYYFAVTAFSVEGFESAYSTEASYLMPGSGGSTTGTNVVLFLAAQGNYNGLITETDEVRHERSGNFTVTSTSRGTYSGRLEVGGKRYGLKGGWADDLKATNVVLRPGLSPLVVELAVDAQAGSVEGRVSGGNWVAELLGDRPGFHARTNPAPAGNYTMVIPPDESNSAGPQGYGYGSVKVDAKGMATFIGMLADGTRATQKAPLSRDGNWPFYLGLYRGGGSVLGWMTVSNSVGEIGGLLSWIKPTFPGKYYPVGLTNEAAVIGSAYVKPAPAEPGDEGRRTELVCSGANLGSLITSEVRVLSNGKLKTKGDGSITFGISPSTGLFKGSVVDPASGKARLFSGVLLQKWNSGAGLILGTNHVGLVELSQD